MSTNLFWEPVKPKSHNTLPYELKKALQTTYQFPVDITVGLGLYEFFRGLAAGGVKGASEVLDLIDKYGEIHLEER